MRLRSCVALLALIILLPCVACCDGGYIPKIDDRSIVADISEPTQKAVIMHWNGHERMILQVTYKGSVSGFVWLVPTPSKPKVRSYDYPAFHWLGQRTAPRLHYWLWADYVLQSGIISPFMRYRKAVGGKTAETVDVLERRRIGIYDVAVLNAKDGYDLIKWLHTNGYDTDRNMESIFDDYIHRGWFFTAARISTTRGTVERAMREGTLQALQFDFSSRQPVYPLKISSLNHGPTRVLLYVCARHSMQAESMEALCVRDGPDAAFAKVTGEDFRGNLRTNKWPSWYLTKLSGQFTPEQMNRDLILTQAKNDELFRAAEVSPPFLENLGALCLLILTLPFVLPFNIVTCLVCWGVSSRLRPGSKLHNVLTIICFYCGVSWLLSWLAIGYLVQWIGDLGYWWVGLAVCIGAAIAMLVLIARRLLRKPNKPVSEACE